MCDLAAMCAVLFHGAAVQGIAGHEIFGVFSARDCRRVYRHCCGVLHDIHSAVHMELHSMVRDTGDELTGKDSQRG